MSPFLINIFQVTYLPNSFDVKISMNTRLLLKIIFVIKVKYDLISIFTYQSNNFIIYLT